MSSTFEKLSGNQVKLTITVPAADFEAGLLASYNKNKNRLAVPGFRKGKAPRRVIENYYGPSVLFEDAIEFVFPRAYQDALEEHKVEPVDQPEVDIESIGQKEDLVFTATVYVRPEVTLGQYKGLETAPIHIEVTDEDVDKELAAAQERLSRWIDVDRPAAEGDRVTLDYAGTKDGVAFDGGTAEGQPLVLGSHSFIPGFEEKLVGLAKDQEADLDLTFPEDYHEPSLAGAAVVFHVHIIDIKQKEVPALDDEFASEASEFETLDEYKAHIRQHEEEHQMEHAKSDRSDDLIAKAAANAEMDIPECMVDTEIHDMIDSLSQRMSYQGIQLEQFLTYTGQTMESLHQQYEEPAMKRVRAELTLSKIAETEGLDASDEEIDEAIVEYAKNMQQDVEELKKMITDRERAYFKDIVIKRKTVDILNDTCVEVEPAVEETTEAPAEDATPAE